MSARGHQHPPRTANRRSTSPHPRCGSLLAATSRRPRCGAGSTPLSTDAFLLRSWSSNPWFLNSRPALPRARRERFCGTGPGVFGSFSHQVRLLDWLMAAKALRPESRTRHPSAGGTRSPGGSLAGTRRQTCRPPHRPSEVSTFPVGRRSNPGAWSNECRKTSSSSLSDGGGPQAPFPGG